MPCGARQGSCRLASGDTQCIDIAGATGASLRLAGANLTDDGAQLRAVVSGANGSANAGARLTVSSMPGVVFQARDFDPVDWVVSASLDPPGSSATHSESRAATGGNPAAFRRMDYDLPATTAVALRVLHKALTAVYDPKVQGAVHAIDFAEDCTALSLASSNNLPYTVPMLAQGGRKFSAAASWRWLCGAANWTAVPLRASLLAQDFVAVEGPACEAGQA